MHNVFDQLAKGIGLTALGPCGLTVANDEIAPDAHHADLRHEPDPARHAERARLGLLGRIASVLCLIEIFSSAPGEDDTLGCVAKLIGFRQRRRRDARKQRIKHQARPFLRPFVWIITAARPTAILPALPAVRLPDWPPGVYFSAGVLHDAGGPDLDGAGGLFRVGLVVASELPRDRSTLLVRLMAGGPLLSAALEELNALPRDAIERTIAAQILVSLRRVIHRKVHRTQKEKEAIVDLATYGANLLKEAHNKGMVDAILTVLAARGIPVSKEERARIKACKSERLLDRWLTRAVTVASVAQVFNARAVRLDGAASGPIPRRAARARAA